MLRFHSNQMGAEGYRCLSDAIQRNIVRLLQFLFILYIFLLLYADTEQNEFRKQHYSLYCHTKLSQYFRSKFSKIIFSYLSLVQLLYLLQRSNTLYLGGTYTNGTEMKLLVNILQNATVRIVLLSSITFPFVTFNTEPYFVMSC